MVPKRLPRQPPISDPAVADRTRVNADGARRHQDRASTLRAFCGREVCTGRAMASSQDTRNWRDLAATGVRAYTRSMKVTFRDAARAMESECICMRVRRTSRALSRLYDENLRPTGLQASQLTLLGAAAALGDAGANMGKMADVLGMDRTTLTRNVRPLEKAGLLRVARDPADARARIVLLTRAGEQAIEEAFPLWEKSQKQVRSLLGASQVENLHEHLKRTLALVST
jgi:DNA-binding MarR family transcriptional regulator